MLFREPNYYATDPRAPLIDMAIGDFDKDGDVDILTAQYEGGFGAGSVNLLTNRGYGQFSAALQVSQISALALAVGDVNGDGSQDFMQMGFDLSSSGFPAFARVPLATYLGNGDGTFSRSTSNSIGDGADIELADLNEDGKSDLIIAKRIYPANDYASAVAQIAVRLSGAGNPDSEIITTLSARPNQIEVADLNGDSHLDLVVTTLAGFSVLFGAGSGTFERTDYPIPGGANKVAAADFNGDGRADLAIGGSLWINNADATFSQIQALPTGWSVLEARDLDGDQMPDIVARSGQDLSVFRNQGGGVFGPRTDLFKIGGNAFVLADFNGDGVSDVAATAPASLGAGVWVSLQSNPKFRSPASDDFDGDGRSDILWRNVNGTTHIWEMNGTQQIGGGNTTSQTILGWQIQGSGDFNGDGRADILWRDGAGQTEVWLLDGTSDVAHRATSSQAPTVWRVQDIADFNGDGESDILWRHEDGSTNIWLMDGGTQVGGGNTVLQAPNVWKVQGTGDFNGDGKADILWRHEDGRTHIWLMDGTDYELSGGDTDSRLDSTWKVQETGDFNGDAKSDILWRNDDGQTQIWFMNGTHKIGGGNTVSQAGTAWSVEKAGDFNGDGYADILWRNQNGSTFIWLMDGMDSLAHGYTNSQAPTDWHIL